MKARNSKDFLGSCLIYMHPHNSARSHCFSVVVFSLFLYSGTPNAALAAAFADESDDEDEQQKVSYMSPSGSRSRLASSEKDRDTGVPIGGLFLEDGLEDSFRYSPGRDRDLSASGHSLGTLKSLLQVF